MSSLSGQAVIGSAVQLRGGDGTVGIVFGVERGQAFCVWPGQSRNQTSARLDEFELVADVDHLLAFLQALAPQPRQALLPEQPGAPHVTSLEEIGFITEVGPAYQPAYRGRSRP